MKSTETTHQLDQLPLEEGSRLALKSLLGDLGINARFTAYRGVVDFLLSLLRKPSDLPRTIQPHWERAAELVEQLAPHLLRMPATSPAFVLEHKRDYPILTAIYAEARQEDRAKMDFLKCLLLGSVFVQHFARLDFKEEIVRAAHEIRLAHRDEERVAVLPKRQQWVFDEEELRLLYDHLLNVKAENQREKNRGFAKSLERLCKRVLETSGQNFEPPSLFWVEEDPDAELPETGEALANVDQESVIELLQGGEGVPEPVLEQAVVEGEGRGLPGADLGHRGRLAHFLGRRWWTPYRWGRGGINPLDEPSIALLLQKLPYLVEAPSKPELARVPALVLALVAATSRALDQLLDWVVAPSGSLHPDGFWQRHVALPEGAYSQPGSDPDGCFLRVGTELTLPLPPPIPHLLKMILPPDGSPRTLGELLGLDSQDDKAQQAVRREINQTLSNYVREQVTLESIRPWARNRAHLQLKCEVRTFFLFGDKDRHRPPIGLFYYSRPLPELVEDYRSVVWPLFGVSHDL